MRLLCDDRAVSLSVGAILLYTVTVIALVVIVLSFSDMMMVYQDSVMREHFEIEGCDIAVRITNLDILVSAPISRGETVDTIEYDLDIPMRIVKRYYELNVTSGEIILSSSQGKNTEVRVPFNTTTPIEPSVIYSSAGDHKIRYNATSGRIEVI